MTIKNKSNSLTTIGYLSGDTSKVTRITLYEYKRVTPGDSAKLSEVGFISLPFPERPPVDSYGMDVQGKSLDIFGNIDLARKADNLLNEQTRNDLIAGLANTSMTIAERMGLMGGNDYSKIAGATAAQFLALTPGISDTQLGGYAQSLAGIVRNPHTTVLFNGVHLREFSLTWQLSPRDSTQSENIDRIINLLKVSMHPNKTEGFGGFSLDYPNLARVSFDGGDKQGLPEIDYAFITGMTVDPVHHAYYKGGYPSFINLTISLMETRIKTAEDFRAYSSITNTTGSDVNFK